METAGQGVTNQESGDHTEASRYSQTLYPNHAYAETHPDRLAVIGLLFGADPPAVENGRVLEIGCGDGANLIPIALSLPHSECIGIDLAPVPVQIANSVIAELGIGNVRCEIMDAAARQKSVNAKMDFRRSGGAALFRNCHLPRK